MANKTINQLPTASTIDGSADLLPIYTASLVATQSISRNTLLGITGSPVGSSDTQALTNKTIGNTNTITLKDTLFTLQDDGDTTKQAKFQLSGLTTATTRTYTLPDVTDTLVTLAAAQTLTNKTLTSPTISSPTITNATLSADAITGFSSASTGTIYGISVASGAIQSSTAFADSVILPKALATGTGSSWAWQAWTPTFTNWTIGTGGSAGTTALFIQIGKSVYFRINTVLGSSGSSVGGAVSFTLPITTNSSAYSVGSPVGTVRIRAAGTGYIGVVRWSTTTSADIIVINASATYATEANLSATVPNTFTSADSLLITGYYEAA